MSIDFLSESYCDLLHYRTPFNEESLENFNCQTFAQRPNCTDFVYTKILQNYSFFYRNEGNLFSTLTLIALFISEHTHSNKKSINQHTLDITSIVQLIVDSVYYTVYSCLQLAQVAAHFLALSSLVINARTKAGDDYQVGRFGPHKSWGPDIHRHRTGSVWTELVHCLHDSSGKWF